MLFNLITQIIAFLPFAMAINISYNMLRATDLTLDGSFVLGAGIFAHLVTNHYSPYAAMLIALLAGALAGVMVSLIQRNNKVDPLLAGILATFILISVNLILMGKPNINLLDKITLVSFAFNKSNTMGWLLVSFYSISICFISYLFIITRIGIVLRALGDNPLLLNRVGKKIEIYRSLGFAFTNTLAAFSGLLTAQTIGYADINMGLGLTLTGLGALLLGQQIFYFFSKKSHFRAGFENLACLLGITLYFFIMNILLKMDINSIYLKMMMGIILIFFLRSASSKERFK